MIMINRLLTLLMLAAWPVAPAGAAELRGVPFEDRITDGDTSLELRGLGLLRYRWVFTVYAAALYTEADADAQDVLDDVGKRLEISYFRGFTAEQFRESTRVFIAKNVPPEEYEGLELRIEELNALYQDVQPGDRYALTYVRGRGTELALNGEPLGSVEGAEFAAALFSIWLGQEPLDAPLKSALLGER